MMEIREMSGDDSSIVLFESFIFFVPFVRKRRREIKFESEYYYAITFVSYPILFVKNDKCGMENGTK